jgi:tetratricopeptide (TPR) repeat protein
MRKCSSPVGAVALVAALSAGLAGCGQIAMLKAKVAFKEANTLYGAQNYLAASKKYEEAIEQGCSGNTCNPDQLVYSYFFLGSSYDQLFRPTKLGDAENDAYMQKAIELYAKATELIPDAEYKKRALQYTALAYGPEKLNDPEKAEPIIQRLITMDPNDPTNYYQLSKLAEGIGDFAKAEDALTKARDAKPNDPEVYGQLARFYEARGQFEKQMEALYARAEREPNSPEAHHTIAATYWNKACLPTRPQCAPIAAPTDALKAKYIQAGMEAEEKALKLREDYTDALTFKNLLLRSQSWLEKDVNKRNALTKEAEELQAKVTEIMKRRSAAGQKPTGKTE